MYGVNPYGTTPYGSISPVDGTPKKISMTAASSVDMAPQSRIARIVEDSASFKAFAAILAPGLLTDRISS